VTVAPAERTGLLVIRAWIESNGQVQLRARITRTLDLERRAEVSTAASTRDQIVATVEKWLDVFLDDGALTQR